MLFGSIRSQMNIMFRRKTAIITFYIMLLFVLSNYISNVLLYRGYDVIAMYQPVKLLLLSSENIHTPFGFYLMQIYPILIVLPVGFSLALDKESHTMLFLRSRVGNKNYFAGKIIATFLTALIIFSLPLLLEIALNYLSFPKEAIGNLSNLNSYSDDYLTTVRSYPLYQIYVYHPYIYAIGWSLVFGMVAGMLNVFTIAVSILPIPYKVLLFLPVYLFLNGLYWIGNLLPNIHISTNYFFLLQMFFSNLSGYGVFYGIIVILFLFSIAAIMKKSQMDYLN